MRKALLLLALVAGCSRGPCVRHAQPQVLGRLEAEPAREARVTAERIVFHPVRLDAQGLLLPAQPTEAPFADVARLGFSAFVSMKEIETGKKPYYSASMFKPVGPNEFAPGGWLHNPPGLAAMLVRSSLRWYAWGGDRAPIEHTRAFVDHVLLHGLTAESDAWSRVPYSSANGGELEYKGGNDLKYCDLHDACGRGDGPGFLEPDKIGELGHALVLLYRFTGEQTYLEHALRFADQLARHRGEGDGKRSPWPFRVDAKTNTVVREPYTSNWIFTVAFFDELSALGKTTPEHQAARAATWAWLRKYPLETMHWQGFFEDIPIYLEPGTNPNQYSAGETARYLLDHPEADPKSLELARKTVRWIDKTFTVDVDAPNFGKTPGHWHGAEVISEQGADMAKMSSHTARYASLLARIYERTGETDLRFRAFRSFSWATYCVDPNGVVKIGPDDREGYWFSDGYGDFMIHYLDGMASVPAWAPAREAHVPRTHDVLREVTFTTTSLSYKGTGPGHEEIRLPGAPTVSFPNTIAGGKPGTFKATPIPSGGVLLTIDRAAPEVLVTWK